MNLTAAETKLDEVTKSRDKTYSVTYISTEKNARFLSVDCYIRLLIDDDLVTFHGRAKTKQEAHASAAAKALSALLDDSDDFWLKHPSLKSNNSDGSD